MPGKHATITKYKLNKKRLPSLSRQAAKRLDTMRDNDIDYSDIPDLSQDDDFWTRPELAVPHKKQQLTLRLDSEVIEWFKAQGKGYQTKINAILQTYMKAHS